MGRGNFDDQRGACCVEYSGASCDQRGHEKQHGNCVYEEVAKQSNSLNELATGGQAPCAKAVHQTSCEQGQRKRADGSDGQCQANDRQRKARSDLKVEDGEWEVHP